MNIDIPVVAGWDSHPRNLKDAQGRFELSEWNYFLVDQEAGVLMGYWLAEGGLEVLGEDDFDEVLHVIEGHLYVTCEGSEYVAGPGDTVVVRQGRETRVEVRERTRAFFVCYPMDDPGKYEQMVLDAMARKGIE